MPADYGGQGIRLVELFELLIELSEADSNITQLRAHFGFIEHALDSPVERRERWLARLAKGVIVGAAWSETGEAPRSQFATRLTRDANGWHLNGTKFYTTGSLFADWIHVGATNADDEAVSVTVDRRADGVEVIDDWDGMGQRLTASGTSRFDNVKVDEREIVAGRAPFPYSKRSISSCIWRRSRASAGPSRAMRPPPSPRARAVTATRSARAPRTIRNCCK